MAMVSTHGAPQVTYPAGRWRFYPYLLALVWLLQLGVGIAAHAVGDRSSWPLLWAMLGLGWLGLGLYVGCSPPLFSTGALTWAGGAHKR